MMIATDASGMSAISEKDVIRKESSTVKKNITKILENTLKNVLETAFRPFLNVKIGEMLNATLAGMKPESSVVNNVSIRTRYNTKIIGIKITIMPS